MPTERSGTRSSNDNWDKGGQGLHCVTTPNTPDGVDEGRAVIDYKGNRPPFWVLLQHAALEGIQCILECLLCFIGLQNEADRNAGMIFIHHHKSGEGKLQTAASNNAELATMQCCTRGESTSYNALHSNGA